MDRFRGSPRPARTCAGGSRTSPNPSLQDAEDPARRLGTGDAGLTDGIPARRRRDTGDKAAARLPYTTARLVQFTIVTRTRGGRAKTSTVRLLTTLLDHEQHPAREIAILYAERWQIETAFLDLKKTLRGARRFLRGSPKFLPGRRPGVR